MPKRDARSKSPAPSRATAENLKKFNDFGKDKTTPRLVVLGRTGAGKSFLLNIISGLRCFYVSGSGKHWMNGKGDYDDLEPAPEKFVSRASATSTTSSVKVAKESWLGDMTMPVLVVDTPGTDDVWIQEAGDDRRKVAAFESGRARDFCVSLRGLRTVNCFLILQGDVKSGDAAKILRSLKASFACDDPAHRIPDEELWARVVIGVSNLNPGERNWDEFTDEKKEEVREFLDRALDRPANAAPLTVVKLGGLENPRRPPPAGTKATGELDQVWEVLQSGHVSTEHAVAEKSQIEELVEIQDREKLQEDYTRIAALGLGLLVLFVRNFLDYYLYYLLGHFVGDYLDHYLGKSGYLTMIDEVLLVIGLFYYLELGIMGAYKVIQDMATKAWPWLQAIAQRLPKKKKD